MNIVSQGHGVMDRVVGVGRRVGVVGVVGSGSRISTTQLLWMLSERE